MWILKCLYFRLPTEHFLASVPMRLKYSVRHILVRKLIEVARCRVWRGGAAKMREEGLRKATGPRSGT